MVCVCVWIVGWMDVRLVVRCTVGWIVGGDYCLDEYMEEMMNR